AAIGLGLQTLVRAVEAHPPDLAAVARQVAELRGLAQDVMNVASRRAHGLRPSVLDQLGLASALQSAAERWHAEWGVEVALVATPLPRLDPPAAIALYRVAEEAAAHAAGHLALFLRSTPAGVELRIVDDNPDTTVDLVAIRERLAGVGGQLSVSA